MELPKIQISEDNGEYRLTYA